MLTKSPPVKNSPTRITTRAASHLIPPYAEKPPSIVKLAPVIYPASGPAR